MAVIILSSNDTKGWDNVSYSTESRKFKSKFINIVVAQCHIDFLERKNNGWSLLLKNSCQQAQRNVKMTPIKGVHFYFNVYVSCLRCVFVCIMLVLVLSVSVSLVIYVDKGGRKIFLLLFCYNFSLTLRHPYLVSTE